MRCPYCNHENPVDYRFCGSCGRSPAVSAASASADVVRTFAFQAPTSTGGATSVSSSVSSDSLRPDVALSQDGSGDNGRNRDVTRYLCAAVNMDENLARAAIDDVLDEQHRAIAITPGADLVTTMKYALHANRRRVARDGLLLFIFCGLIVSIFLTPLSPLFVVIFFILLIAAWLTVFMHGYTGLFGSAAQGLRPDKFDSSHAPAPRNDPFAERQLAEIASTCSPGNVTVYSAFSPFIGYGNIQSSWSFAVDVTNGEHGAKPMPFTVRDVYDHVKESLMQLDLPGVEVADRLFVNGRDIYSDRRFLPEPSGRPVTQVDDDVLRTLMSAPEERARPYLAVSMGGWQGDLVVTIFIRFLLSHTDLFVESAATAVPPLRPWFREIDKLEAVPTPRQFSQIVWWASKYTLPKLLGSAKGVFRALTENSRRGRKLRKVDRTSDFGALFSIREAAADNNWQRYFQVFDYERYTKVIEQRVFRSLVEFLDDHEVGTSELVSRQETIINNGVMISGKGSLQASQVAVGKEARATGLVSRIRRQQTQSSGGKGS